MTSPSKQTSNPHVRLQPASKRVSGSTPARNKRDNLVMLEPPTVLETTENTALILPDSVDGFVTLPELAGPPRRASDGYRRSLARCGNVGQGVAGVVRSRQLL